MSREEIRHRLDKARLLVLQGTKRVERQAELIAILKQDGHFELLPDAKKVLRQMEDALALYVRGGPRSTRQRTRRNTREQAAVVELALFPAEQDLCGVLKALQRVTR